MGLNPICFEHIRNDERWLQLGRDRIEIKEHGASAQAEWRGSARAAVNNGGPATSRGGQHGSKRGRRGLSSWTTSSGVERMMRSSSGMARQQRLRRVRESTAVRRTLVTQTSKIGAKDFDEASRRDGLFAKKRNV
ncbi:hypothetical protein Scep_026472 [Stephania cephalantha]|uniref:Uncharacterized protein n=1 Tax=Stephania cephalantha TaxID=152367 RepID=A0AAP0ESH3_9MAGN